jgi:hypothetical protein
MRRNAREAALEGIAEADPPVNGAAERCDSHGECARRLRRPIDGSHGRHVRFWKPCAGGRDAQSTFPKGSRS